MYHDSSLYEHVGNNVVKKGKFYHVLCRPFDRPGAWRTLIYQGYDLTKRQA
jgi:hypothetical protein